MSNLWMVSIVMLLAAALFCVGFCMGGQWRASEAPVVPMHSDTMIVYAVVRFIGATFFGGLAGLFILAALKIPTSEGLSNIVAGLGGSLGTLLATTRTGRREEGPPVEVVTPPNQPLQTEDVSKDDKENQNEPND